MFQVFNQNSIQQKSNRRRIDWNRNDLKLNKPLASYQVSQNQNPLLYNQPWQQLSDTNQIYRNKNDNFNQRNYPLNRQTSPSERNFISTMRERQMKFVPKGRSLELHDTEMTKLSSAEESTDDNWEHHYAHRDRRDLYERIEKALPLAL